MTEGKQYSLMLVDDDQFLLNMYSLKFQKSGFSVTTVPGTQEALNKLREGFSPDIMLFDIIMPGMDGLELLKTVRKEKLAPDAMVIMLTNQGDGIERAKELGVSGYIVKATTVPSEVVTEVQAIIEKKGKK